jgi:hypothetical protein
MAHEDRPGWRSALKILDSDASLEGGAGPVSSDLVRCPIYAIVFEKDGCALGVRTIFGTTISHRALDSETTAGNRLGAAGSRSAVKDDHVTLKGKPWLLATSMFRAAPCWRYPPAIIRYRAATVRERFDEHL